jgi:CDP-diacylglycerol--glycerol-3-phosphate 3-phosphatidyltransferase
MLTIYDLKPKFQQLLRPIATWLADEGVTANQVTYFAMFISMLTGILIYITHAAVWSLLLLPLILFIRMALNAIDGMLAREHNMQTMKGAMLNEMTDVISDIALYLPLTIAASISPSLLIAFVIVGLLTEMAGVVAQAINNDRRYDGPMGKSDRAFTMGLLAIIVAFELLSAVWVVVYLAIATLMALITLYNRMSKGIKTDKKE